MGLGEYTWEYELVDWSWDGVDGNLKLVGNMAILGFGWFGEGGVVCKRLTLCRVVQEVAMEVMLEDRMLLALAAIDFLYLLRLVYLVVPFFLKEVVLCSKNRD